MSATRRKQSQPRQISKSRLPESSDDENEDEEEQPVVAVQGKRGGGSGSKKKTVKEVENQGSKEEQSHLKSLLQEQHDISDEAILDVPDLKSVPDPLFGMMCNIGYTCWSIQELARTKLVKKEAWHKLPQCHVAVLLIRERRCLARIRDVGYKKEGRFPDLNRRCSTAAKEGSYFCTRHMKTRQCGDVRSLPPDTLLNSYWKSVPVFNIVGKIDIMNSEHSLEAVVPIFILHNHPYVRYIVDTEREGFPDWSFSKEKRIFFIKEAIKYDILKKDSHFQLTRIASKGAMGIIADRISQEQKVFPSPTARSRTKSRSDTSSSSPSSSSSSSQHQGTTSSAGDGAVAAVSKKAKRMFTSPLAKSSEAEAHVGGATIKSEKGITSTTAAAAAAAGRPFTILSNYDEIKDHCQVIMAIPINFIDPEESIEQCEIQLPETVDTFRGILFTPRLLSECYSRYVAQMSGARSYHSEEQEQEDTERIQEMNRIIERASQPWINQQTIPFILENVRLLFYAENDVLLRLVGIMRYWHDASGSVEKRFKDENNYVLNSITQNKVNEAVLSSKELEVCKLVFAEEFMHRPENKRPRAGSSSSMSSMTSNHSIVSAAGSAAKERGATVIVRDGELCLNLDGTQAEVRETNGIMFA
jgi:hypothetical protein